MKEMVRCNCGYDIGAFYPHYVAMLAIHTKGMTITRYSSTRKDKMIIASKIFEDLGIPLRECCRMNMISTMNWIDIKYGAI